MIDDESTNQVQGGTVVRRLGSGGTEVVVIEDIMREVRVERIMHMETRFHDGHRRRSDRERM